MNSVHKFDTYYHFQGEAHVHEGIDYVYTVHNFVRHRLHDIFNLVLNHSEYD